MKEIYKMVKKKLMAQDKIEKDSNIKDCNVQDEKCFFKGFDANV